MISIALLKIDEIVPSEQPIYEVSDKEKRALKKSIREIGLMYPLIVTREGGKYKILDGRTRFQILKQLKWENIPCLIVKNEDEWLKKRFRIPYDVELFRRHLSYDERKRYEQLLEEKLAAQDVISEIICNLFTPKIAEKIKEVVLNRFHSRFVNRVLADIKDLSEEEQIQILERIEAKVSPKEIKELENLKAKVEKLEAEKEKINEEREEEMRRFAEKLKAKVEKELEKKKKELEAQYKGKKEELDEDDLRRLMEEERKRIYAEYKEEIDEFQKKLDMMVKNIKCKDEEIKNLKEQIKSLTDQYKRAVKEANKYREDVEYFARILESLKGIDRLKKELLSILEELQNIKRLLVELGEDYTLELPEEGIKEVISMLKDIGKTAKEVEELFKEYS